MQQRFVVMVVLLLAASFASAASPWIAGKHYQVIEPAINHWMPQDGKIEVTEVFSYACPACNAFYPYADKLAKSLPKNAVMTYLPASFLPQEDWPMFQRAWCTAETLGVAKATHHAMFNAVWQSGELATIDMRRRRIKEHLPTIEDAARFYNRVAGIPLDKFLATAHSFGVDAMTKRADNLVKDWKVHSTPTIVVAGKYRTTVSDAGSVQKLIELVNYLVRKEAGQQD